MVSSQNSLLDFLEISSEFHSIFFFSDFSRILFFEIPNGIALEIP